MVKNSRASYLAGATGLSSVPAAVRPTVASEGGAPAQQDVEDDPQAPEVTALIVERGLVCEHLHHLRGHVLCRPTLGEKQVLSVTWWVSHVRGHLVMFFAT